MAIFLLLKYDILEKIYTTSTVQTEKSEEVWRGPNYCILQSLYSNIREKKKKLSVYTNIQTSISRYFRYKNNLLIKIKSKKSNYYKIAPTAEKYHLPQRWQISQRQFLEAYDLLLVHNNKSAIAI